MQKALELPKCDVAIAVTSLGRGGTERYVMDLAIGLVRRCIRLAVVYDRPPEDRRAEIEAAGVNTYRICSSESQNYSVSLANLLRALRPRVLHTNVWERQRSILNIAQALRIPVIVSRHGTDQAPRFRDLIGLNSVPFYLHRERSAMRRSGAGLICVSRVGMECAERRFGAQISSKTVYTGVPLKQTVASVSDDTHGIQVIWVGEMCDLKRPLLAIRAFAKVLQKISNARLLMLGGGSELERTRRMAAEFPVGAIRVPGYVHDPLPEMLKSHVFLHTAMSEGIPYSIREAMSVGLPVVATDAGGTREAVQHEKTGFLAAVDDEHQIASFLERLLQDASLRKAYGEAGLALCRSRFSLDQMIEGTLDAYRELCGVSL